MVQVRVWRDLTFETLAPSKVKGQGRPQRSLFVFHTRSSLAHGMSKVRTFGRIDLYRLSEF